MASRSYVEFLRIAAGEVDNFSVVKVFGHNEEVGTTFEPVSQGGIFRTPQVSGATALRVKAGNANDAPGGSGARSVRLVGLDETGALVEEVVNTGGASAGPDSARTFMRLLRAEVEESGTYGGPGSSSHAADVVIENAAGSEDWATIAHATLSFGDGQTQIGAYTIPLGYRGWIGDIEVQVDSTKATTIHIFQRRNILDTSAPYSALRAVAAIENISASIDIGRVSAYGPFPELTDILPMALVDSTTADVAINFDVFLEEQ